MWGLMIIFKSLPLLMKFSLTLRICASQEYLKFSEYSNFNIYVEFTLCSHCSGRGALRCKDSHYPTFKKCTSGRWTLIHDHTHQINTKQAVNALNSIFIVKMSKQRAWCKEPCPQDSGIILILPLAFCCLCSMFSRFSLLRHHVLSLCHVHVCTDVISEHHRPLSRPIRGAAISSCPLLSSSYSDPPDFSHLSGCSWLIPTGIQTQSTHCVWLPCLSSHGSFSQRRPLPFLPPFH